MSITRSIDLYEDDREVTLTTYLFDDSKERSEGRKRPAILICPGGGYLGCSEHEAEPVALRFAGLGYHAFVLRYSTYYGRFPDTVDAEGMSMKSTTIYPAPVRDIAKAFLVITDHAKDWSVDADKICICGFSAGAHNCMMYSAYWDKPLITDFFQEEPSRFRPVAAILSYGLSDFHMMKRKSDDPFVEELYNAMSMAYLGTTEPDDSLLDEISPILHVTDTYPPSFIWATGGDELVPAENSIGMALALAKAGIPYELHIFGSGSHGLGLADQSTTGDEILIKHDAAKWFELAETWLVKKLSQI